MDMSLGRRVGEFADVITGCFCTNKRQSEVGLESAVSMTMGHLQKLKLDKHRLYIVGNGGSAAVASHALVDFVNVAKINAQVLHESSLVTCMANDFGYPNVYSRVLQDFINPEDMLIAISSSGNSQNICQAAEVAREKQATVVTLTGFNKDNPLRQLGDINYWLNSNDYGYVEVGHQFILHNLSDRFGVMKMQEQKVFEELELD